MKRNSTHSLLLFFALFSIPYSYGQTISGTVSDASGKLQGAKVLVKGTNRQTTTNHKGRYAIAIDSLHRTLVFSHTGMVTKEVTVRDKKKVDVTLEIQISPVIERLELEEESTDGLMIKMYRERSPLHTTANRASPMLEKSYNKSPANTDTEGYSTIRENDFRAVSKNPLSTFSVDVDRAAYSNVRRHINNGALPPVDAVRIEEMINYFDYDYAEPQGDAPFGVHTELSSCPWNADHLLLQIGLQGKKIDMENLPQSNIVFLIDVSGSMDSPNKLPLLKSSFKLLLSKLKPEDRVAIVVYAGSSGLVLPSTNCSERKTITDALESLSAGGSTAGGEGLQLAYAVAEENYIEGGNNRIVLATDGDFNVGQSSNGDMERLIEKEREKGIALSVLGFGMGNYKDDKMEIIADKGNGNYAYIDNLLEARKVLVKEFGGTLFTIAKDVKLQLEFNPKIASSYRLIGYENRLLNEEDFEDDKKDAGEIGAGHTVTALYEIVPKGEKSEAERALKYQSSQLTDKAKKGNELVTIQLRYKHPDKEKSKLMEQVVANASLPFGKTSDNFRFSCAVVEFGMLLRDSKYKGSTGWDTALELAKKSKGEDKEGYRGELIRLLESAKLLSKNDLGGK